MAIVHSLSIRDDGATRLAALHVYANLCAHPANAPLLLRTGTMGLLCGLLVDDAAAEVQQVAVRALGHMSAHAPLTPWHVARTGLLDELVLCAQGKQFVSRHRFCIVV